VIRGNYRKFSYFLFRWVDNKPRTGIEESLYKADILMLPGMYVGIIAVTAIFASAATFVGSYFLFTDIIPSGSYAIYYMLGVTGAAGGMSLLVFPLMTQNKISSKRVKIENALPFVLAYMATLSSAGMNPVEVIRHVGLKDFGPTSTEFRKIVYRFDMLGRDIIAAINYVALNTPSQSLHDMLIGISNIIISGGSLKSYCDQESKNLFDQKKNKLKQFIDSLAAYSEGYLGGITVAVIMGLVAIILLGSLGIKLIPGLNTQDLMLIFVFFMIPFANIVFLGLLELKFSGDTT
jgi:archaellum biogenesis protein FlaJ (TadC family)